MQDQGKSLGINTSTKTRHVLEIALTAQSLVDVVQIALEALRAGDLNLDPPSSTRYANRLEGRVTHLSNLLQDESSDDGCPTGS